MQFSLPHGAPAMIAAAALALGSVGCASKGFVRKTVSPVEQRVGEVENTTASNTSKIESLDEKVDRDVSRLDERTRAAQGRADEAATLAERAGGEASKAGERANSAFGLAEQGNRRVDGLETTVANLDNYKMASSESIQFGFDKAELTPESKTQLDGIGSQLAGKTNYALEIRGYTDTAGNPEYNLDLSKRRSEAVVRYLTVEHKVPMFRIHNVGLGEAEPTAENKTREGREKNRRVEVKLFVADVELTSRQISDASASTTAQR